MRWELIGLESREQWKRALDGVPHAFSHTWESCFAMRETTGCITFLACGSGDDRRVVCPIAERTRGGWTDIATPFGFGGFTATGEVPGLASEWRRLADSRDYVCGYIALNPFFERNWRFDPAEVFSTNSLYFLDLERSEDEILTSMDRNRHRQLRNGPGNGALLINDRQSIAEFLVKEYPEFLKRVRASPANQFSKATLEFLCQQPNVLAVGVEQNGRVTAVYLFTYTRYLGDCFLNIAVPEGRRHATALLWRGIQELRARGVPRLNMGGGVREGDSIASAKQRFGGERVPFRALKQVYRPDVYESLCREAGVDPADRGGYFPAYRAPLTVQVPPA